MTYKELEDVRKKAWREFLNVFEEAGLDSKTLHKEMNYKDCFNDVSDAILAAYGRDLECEE